MLFFFPFPNPKGRKKSEELNWTKIKRKIGLPLGLGQKLFLALELSLFSFPAPKGRKKALELMCLFSFPALKGGKKRWS